MSRQSWIDESSNEVLIDDYAKNLGPFLDAFADGHIDDGEVAAQEERLIALMKDVEPKLDDETHAAVTQMMCELSAFNIMQFANEIQQHRPKSKFVG